MQWRAMQWRVAIVGVGVWVVLLTLVWRESGMATAVTLGLLLVKVSVERRYTQRAQRAILDLVVGALDVLGRHVFRDEAARTTDEAARTGRSQDLTLH
jgi:hypothetical protein